MTVILDHCDSFSHSLYQMVGAVAPQVQVVSWDGITLQQLYSMHPSRLILSSGPASLSHQSIGWQAVEALAATIPILGIGLGHHILCQVFGAETEPALQPLHGRADAIHIANGSPIFKGIAPLLEAAMYRSHVVGRPSLPDCLLVIAEDQQGQVMGIKHKNYPAYGLQFHPESILTPGGGDIIKNFVEMGE